MNKQFETSADFSKAIDSALSPSTTSDALRAALVAGVDQGEAEQRATAPHPADGALNLRISNWILRGQDMPILELIGIVGAAATAALAPGVIAAGAIVTALTSFATLCWKTWRKGAPLSKPEIAVLGFLQVHGPLTDAGLLAKMHGTLDLTDEDITNAIKTLQNVELRDGSFVPLIRKDAADQWRPQNN